MNRSPPTSSCRLAAALRYRLSVEEAIDARISDEKEIGGKTVALMKINVEGGEYELLEHLIAKGLTKRIWNIQVQFHEDVMAGAARRMERIQSKLAKTHHLTYQERFVWENWELTRGMRKCT